MLDAETITKADLDMLDNVRLLNARGLALMPDSIGDLSRLRKLEREGLLDSDWTRHEDTGREGHGFNLTAHGERILNARAANAIESDGHIRDCGNGGSDPADCSPACAKANARAAKSEGK